MRRSRIVSIILVLALANYLVFSNLVMLLVTAGSEAITRSSPAPTRIVRPTVTAAPVEVAPTFTPLAATPTLAPTLPPISAPTTAPTLAPTPLPLSTLAATRSPTLTLTYPFTYTVKSGDTLSGLADRFLVPRAKIMAANGLTDPNFIRIGQVLIIPDPNQ